MHVTVPLAKASHVAKLWVEVGEYIQREWIQGDMNKWGSLVHLIFHNRQSYYLQRRRRRLATRCLLFTGLPPWCLSLLCSFWWSTTWGGDAFQSAVFPLLIIWSVFEISCKNFGTNRLVLKKLKGMSSRDSVGKLVRWVYLLENEGEADM